MDPALTPEQFAELLRAAYRQRDAELRERFQRSLPLQDAMFDRWERAASLGFGAGASIYNSASLFGDVRVGEQTWVGPNVILDGSGGGIDIGAYCSISSGVQVYTHDTVLWALSHGRLPRAEGAVSIGDCVYIGSQSIVAAGVNIGSRCVVAANSFVNRSVEAGTVVGGTPASPLGRVIGEGESVRIKYFSDEAGAG
jgi:carbonic anhydrase/acetyltransferase-like protein (isoleucine patch superfamily)